MWLLNPKPLLAKYWTQIVLVLVVIVLCWFMWKPKEPVQEVSAPEQRQKDGSVILEKKPDAEAKPKMEIPKGGKVERVVKVTVQAKNPIQTISGSVEIKESIVNMAKSELGMSPVPTPVKMNECPPVTVDLALVRMPDETRRVIASSEDGVILGGVDIPVEAAAPIPKPKVWAAGASYNPLKQTYGGFLDRDMGPFRLGLQANQRNPGELPTEGWIKAGLRF